MARRFDSKVVVITGGGGGIGRASARRFLEEGARRERQVHVWALRIRPSWGTGGRALGAWGDLPAGDCFR